MNEVRSPSPALPPPMPLPAPGKPAGFNWAIGCAIAAAVGLVLLAVVGILAAIAIPSFARARSHAQAAVCMNHLRMLEGAKEQYSLDHASSDGQSVTEAQLAEYIPKDWVSPLL